MLVICQPEINCPALLFRGYRRLLGRLRRWYRSGSRVCLNRLLLGHGLLLRSGLAGRHAGHD